jgi:6-phosphofructokinase 1
VAAQRLREAGIDGLVAIGGDGTTHGAHYLWLEHGVPTIGAPGTIDNDLWGTDETIGYDTAVNTALDAIDRIRDTATSHDRIFFIEVMGRRAGFIALESGLAGGAEMILIPGEKITAQEIHDTLSAGIARGKRTSIIIVAEGDEEGGALEIARKVQDLGRFETRVSILGHIQRGGSPTARDRVLASQLGAAAVQALLEGESNKMAGRVGQQVVLTPFEQTWDRQKDVSRGLYELATLLSS